MKKWLVTRKKLPNRFFCLKCYKTRKLIYGRTVEVVEFRSKNVQYEVIKCFCSKCGWEIEPDSLWDENLFRLKDEYSRVKDNKKEEHSNNS